MLRKGLLATAALIALAAAVLLTLQGRDHAAAATTKSSPVAVKSISVAANGFDLKTPNISPRATINCPGKGKPYGGAMSATPDPATDGEGVYPHSYERLGAQGGYHITPVLYDPSPSETRPYQARLQVVCGKKPAQISDPHKIANNVPPGTSKTLVAKCPRREVLVGGGFQRAAFEFAGGTFPTESRAISKNQWQTSGTAFGGFGTDLVSIAYCLRSPKAKPVVSEVSASVTFNPGTVGTVTTPPCPGSRVLVFGGFGTEPLQSIFYADGIFNPDQSWTSAGWNRSSGPATLTAYGYCLKRSVANGSLKKFGKKK